MLLGFALPFIFMRDWYPFFRFGMFAEPVRYQAQTERHVILVYNGTQVRLFYSPEIGMNRSHFEQIKRQYAYSGRGGKLLGIIASKMPIKPDSLQLLRIDTQTDSLIAVWR